MLDVLASLWSGFGVALLPQNLLFCLIGVTVGTIVGILPGIGTTAAVAILLPLTFKLNATTAMIMLAGIYYGTKYGGSTTSILVNTPGESSSVATCLDGYQMALQGRAGAALGISAIASFIAGTLGLVGLVLLGPGLTRVALSFGPAEYFALMIMGLATVAFLAGESMTKALLMTAFGLLLSTVGFDIFTGKLRFTYGNSELMDGISFVTAATGLFAVGEVLSNIGQDRTQNAFSAPSRLRDLFPSWQDLRDCKGAFVRGTVVGFLIGILPGAGSSVSSFISYALEKRFSRHPEKFGRGAIEGVAGPEGANNADTAGAMVPMLSLGLPGSGGTAILLGALILYGVKPGPMLFQEHPDLVWGLIASMYVGNVMLLVLNLPLVPLFASLLRVPYKILYPLIIGFCVVGVYSIRQSQFDLWLLVAFGVLGFGLRRLDYPLAPVVLGLVLGPLIERALRQAMVLSNGDWRIFVTRPIAASLMLVTLTLLVAPFLFRGRRAAAA
ncbi:MAG TPA: tripartite tricarboxylate transporter permease [Candidatus Acidoferrales bacterium]|nr:tripartite tricarboxylate transporter permease [Candidatus Acidoferrales bacterium]